MLREIGSTYIGQLFQRIWEVIISCSEHYTLLFRNIIHSCSETLYTPVPEHCTLLFRNIINSCSGTLYTPVPSLITLKSYNQCTLEACCHPRLQFCRMMAQNMRLTSQKKNINRTKLFKIRPQKYPYSLICMDFFPTPCSITNNKSATRIIGTIQPKTLAF